jgi:CubicO group peptidase (beta-lactamase class C family)
MLTRTISKWLIASSFIASASALIAADLDKAAPDSVGLSAARLARVDAALKPYIDNKQLAGAVVAIARKNKTVYMKSFGAADVDSNKAMADDAIFRIASMTKPVTSVAVMMLYEEGKFLLDDPISKFIPEFKEPKVLTADGKTVPAKREITIRDLLRHTSGISYRFWGKPIAEVYEKAGIFDGLAPTEGTIAEMTKRIAVQPLHNQPGEAWEYGLNTDVLGYLVEVASGMPLDKFFKERIFNPLKMPDTQFYVSDAQKNRVVSLYTPGEKGGIVKSPDAPTRWGQLIFSPAVPYGNQRSYFSGGGGLTSTASDYLRFTQMFLNGGQLDGQRLLSRKSVELMGMNHIGDISVWTYVSPSAVGNLGDKFGLGFGVRSDAGMNELGSTGEYMWAGIFNTRFWIDPKEQMSIVMLGQIIPRNPEIEAKVHAAVYQAIQD